MQHVITLTFDQFNASLLNKTIKKLYRTQNCETPESLNDRVINQSDINTHAGDFAVDLRGVLALGVRVF